MVENEIKVTFLEEEPRETDQSRLLECYVYIKSVTTKKRYQVHNFKTG